MNLLTLIYEPLLLSYMDFLLDIKTTMDLVRWAWEAISNLEHTFLTDMAMPRFFGFGLYINLIK